MSSLILNMPFGMLTVGQSGYAGMPFGMLTVGQSGYAGPVLHGLVP